MTEEEYKNEIYRIDKFAEMERKKAHRDYALAHNPYKDGDIVTDHIGSILVEQIKVIVPSQFSKNLPSSAYWGTELRKDGKPKKSGVKRLVYQCNLIK